MTLSELTAGLTQTRTDRQQQDAAAQARLALASLSLYALGMTDSVLLGAVHRASIASLLEEYIRLDLIETVLKQDARLAKLLQKMRRLKPKQAPLSHTGGALSLLEKEVLTQMLERKGAEKKTRSKKDNANARPKNRIARTANGRIAHK